MTITSPSSAEPDVKARAVDRPVYPAPITTQRARDGNREVSTGAWERSCQRQLNTSDDAFKIHPYR